jgi:plastocyanin
MTHQNTYDILRTGSTVCAVALLLACGGGDSGTATADAPAPAAATAPAAAPEPLGTARIAGAAVYQGEVPTLPAVRMDADPQCAAKHDAPVYTPELVLGPDNSLGNVFVRVKWPGDAPLPPPAENAVLDQNGCMYQPHVVGVQVGQKFKILNSDGLLHNVHSFSEANPAFNRAMPASVTEVEQTFAKEEFMFRVKCDVHPWMSAFVTVSPHPFYAVTSANGSFEIAGLPAGTYELEAWHERLGTQSATVTVADGETAAHAFTFTR